MNICLLNRSSKVCLEKGPAGHTRTPLSSLPEPNTFFQRILSLSIPCTSQNVPIYYLMNIVAALPAARRYSPLLAA